jgi:hypothetical protein
MTLDEDQTQDGKVAPKETPFVADAASISDQHEADVGDVEFDSMEADFESALDIGTWTSGEQMHKLAARLEKDFEQAARHEEGMAPRILRALEEGLPNAADASKENGLYTLRPDDITGALSNVLFNGLVEGCDGTRVMVPTLPMTVIQIGVCLTSYQGTGDGGSIGHRLYRHDIIRRNGNAENAVYDFLARRARRKMRRGDGFGDDGQETSLSDMMCRALMTYGERAMLTDRSQRPWRIGHGGPMPHELIVGSGRKELAFASLRMLRRLLLEHKKFIFVPSEINDEVVVTIANALLPLQYAVLRNTKDIIQGYIEGSSYERPHYERSGLIQEVRAFQEDAGAKTVLCVYRSSSLAPGRIFYAHEDHVHEAAQIVMADSTLQETRGFPNLIDIADRMCRGMFEPGGLTAQVHAALARTGSPFRFLNERDTRA